MPSRKLLLSALAYVAAVLCGAFGWAIKDDPGALTGRQVVQALGPAMLRRGVDETYVARVLRHGSGKPVAGATVRVLLPAGAGTGERELARGTTGDDGSAKLTIRLPRDVRTGDVRLEVDGASSLGQDRITLEASAVDAQGGPARVLLTPAKTLFKPGETARARALVLGPDGKAATDVAYAFELLGPGGTRVARERGRTSAFGIASVEVPLDAEAQEGRYRFRLLRLDPSEEALLADREVTVKKYRLPAFRIDVAPERRFVRPGEAIQAKVVASTFQGEVVPGAKLRAELRDDRGSVLGSLEETSGASGAARLSLAVPEKLDLGPAHERRVFLEVEAEDAAGRVAKAAAAVFASTVDLRVSALPEGGALVAGVKSRVYFVLEGAGGIPAEGSLELSREEIGRDTKDIATGPEGIALLEDVEPTAEDVTRGFARFWITASAKDVERQLPEAVTVRVDPKAAGVLRAERPFYRAGDRVKLDLLLASSVRLASGTPVLVVAEKDGHTLATGEVRADGSGGATGEIALPAGESGFVQISALVAGGDEVRDVTRRVLVRSPEDLKVALEPDRPEYEPGQEVKLHAKVTGAKGPVVLGLQAIDRAVAELGHAFDFRSEVLRFALGADPGEGRLGRGFASRLFDPSLDDATRARLGDAALGGAAERGELGPRMIASTKARCDSLDAVAWARVKRCLSWAGLALLPAIVLGGISILPWTAARAILVLCLGSILLAAIAIPNLIEARKGSNEAGAIGSLRALSVAGAIQKSERARSGLIDGILGGGVKDGFTWTATANPAAPPAARATMTYFTAGSGGSGPASAATVEPPPEPRTYFPEVLLFRPHVALDERGETEVVFPMADALTEWRIDAVASTAAGAVAHAATTIVSRKDFNVDLHAPPFVRLGDEIEVTAALRNDGRAAVAVAAALEREPWFEAIGALKGQNLAVEPGTVKAVRFRIRATSVGRFAATVRTTGEKQDAARREVEVLPVGCPVARTINGDLGPGPTSIQVLVPGGEDGTERSIQLRLTASPVADAIDGLESLLREPHGCFEQTSSTVWPNTLILGYLRSLPNRDPATEARAADLVRRGYQRLAGFEVQGTGVGSSRVDLQACKLEYSIVSPK